MMSNTKHIVKVIEITTPTCGQCKMIAPSVKKLMSEYSDINFEEINGLDNPDICSKYNVSKVPVFVVIYNDGSETVIREGSVIKLKKVLKDASLRREEV